MPMICILTQPNEGTQVDSSVGGHPPNTQTLLSGPQHTSLLSQWILRDLPMPLTDAFSSSFLWYKSANPQPNLWPQWRSSLHPIKWQVYCPDFTDKKLVAEARPADCSCNPRQKGRNLVHVLLRKIYSIFFNHCVLGNSC